MAIINWNNVTGASSNAGTAALESAGNLFNKALNKFSGIATDAQKKSDKKYDEQFDANSEAALNRIRQVKTQEDLDNFDRSQFTPEVLGKVDQTKINAAIDALQGNITAKERSDLSYKQEQDTYQFNIDERNRVEAKRRAQESIDKGLRGLRTSDVEAKSTNDQIRNQLSNPKYSGYVNFSEGVPSINRNAPAELLNEMTQLTSGFQTRDTEQQDRDAVAALYKQYGGTLPEETQSVTNLKNARKEYNALPEDAKKDLNERVTTLTNEATNNLAANQRIYDETVRDYPTDEILSPEGKILGMTKVTDLVNEKIPEQSPYGVGGVELKKLINDIEEFGITADGIVDSSNKTEKDRTKIFKPTPSQYLLALGFNSTSDEDNWIFDNTINEKDFLNSLAVSASNLENKNNQNIVDGARLTLEESNAKVNSNLIKDTKSTKAKINTDYNITNKKALNTKIKLKNFDAAITKAIKTSTNLSTKEKDKIRETAKTAKVAAKAIKEAKTDKAEAEAETKLQVALDKLKSTKYINKKGQRGNIFSSINYKDLLTPKSREFKPRTRN